MARRISYGDVAEIALGLPEVTEDERRANRTWLVRDKAFAWERPITKADITRFGEAPIPDGEILAVSTQDLHEKDAILAAGTPGLFTMAHFDGYPAFLIQLRVVRRADLRTAIGDAWLACAPDALAEAYVAKRRK